MYITVGQLADKINNLEHFTPSEIRQESELDKAKQYIADVYHCSDVWGEKVTVAEMIVNLTEWNNEKDIGEYCPPVSLAPILAIYWNELCDMYPN